MSSPDAYKGKERRTPSYVHSRWPRGRKIAVSLCFFFRCVVKGVAGICSHSDGGTGNRRTGAPESFAGEIVGGCDTGGRFAEG